MVIIRILFTLVLFGLLLGIAVTDSKTMCIPDRLTGLVALMGAAACFLYPEVGLVSRGVGVFVIAGPMLLVNAGIRDAFGGGDIKLMAAAGLLLGWQNILLSLMIGSIAGSVIHLALMKIQGKDRVLAFGPYLAFGIFISMLYGNDIITWYLGMFHL